jgi:hypothetical protein
VIKSRCDNCLTYNSVVLAVSGSAGSTIKEHMALHSIHLTYIHTLYAVTPQGCTQSDGRGRSRGRISTRSLSSTELHTRVHAAFAAFLGGLILSLLLSVTAGLLRPAITTRTAATRTPCFVSRKPVPMRRALLLPSRLLRLSCSVSRRRVARPSCKPSETRRPLSRLISAAASTSPYIGAAS